MICHVPVKLVVLKRIQVPVKNPVYAVAVLGCLWIVEFGGNGNCRIFFAWYHDLSYRRLLCVLQICDKSRRTQALDGGAFIIGFISCNDMRNTRLAFHEHVQNNIGVNKDFHFKYVSASRSSRISSMLMSPPTWASIPRNRSAFGVGISSLLMNPAHHNMPLSLP